MKTVFVDTSALIAIGNRRDFFHPMAISVRNNLKEMQTRFVVTNAVLLEFGNAFSPLPLKPVAIKLIDAVMQSARWNCINIDDVIMKKGMELYKRMHDKEWGLTDCTSILVARNMGISDVFTADHHFEQAGFSILLKRDEQ